VNFGGFSWRRALGLSAAKARLSRRIGVPLTRSGRQRKIGAFVSKVLSAGCVSEVLTLCEKRTRFAVGTRILKKLPTLGKRGVLFRGHANSRWSLQTTLERRGGVDMSLDAFYRMISRLLPQIESSTGRTFDVPSYSKMRSLFNNYDDFSRTGLPSEVRSYLIYLRHHGLPMEKYDAIYFPLIRCLLTCHAGSWHSEHAGPANIFADVRSPRVVQSSHRHAI